MHEADRLATFHNAKAAIKRRASGISGEPLKIALVVTLPLWTVSVVALFAANRVSLPDAAFFVGAPWAVLAAVFRPDWLVLALVAMPASFTAVIQTRRLLALIMLALLGIVIARRAFSLGLGTGLLALIAIVAAGHLFQADVAAEARLTNQSLMMLISYYGLLTLLAFNLALLGDLDGWRLGTAFVVGVATTLFVGLVGYESPWFDGGMRIITSSYLGYLAVGGLGVIVARLLSDDEPRYRGLGYPLFAASLLFLTISSFSRAVWIAAAMTFVLLAFHSGKRRYALVVFLAVVLSLGIPAVREEIASSESGDIAAALQTGKITTGRWQLWTELWERAQPALPWGNGFGFMWSLSSEELFGTEGVFTEGEDRIPPHNDFMLLLVEFGIPGVLLLSLFWLQLLRAYFRAAGSPNPFLSSDSQAFLGVLMTGLVVALVDNLFAIRPFAERFFVVTGMVFALGRIEQTRRMNAVSRVRTNHDASVSA